MPRVISDELYDQLMGCVKQQRLLGVMRMLERMRDESVPVYGPVKLFAFEELVYVEVVNAKNTANKD